ncbi:MAG: bifunctional (p)ppGpp synthetase/guanosine-3',5'-bis(diphosphate) 3'-pyrophosphohydrolase [Dethiobacteria bacterium]|jgi:GTP pyrophosphokinase|nr:bifunctional (p)ppGpp synthetase/guanosine-3',5'-bis(diphosphate) 3'-pyrophosphohydrolase [Bacillota bacterium]NMD33360.1 bifunctional (p)ppGpp synthetase/guanosine-3',5'-bis(diphosphate) 3'-pyrophosphohydrolase [Bacillota bacterium]HOB28155.1 bifunctional (p)ppGpp synthetase/guanosine-3',5'-bis(diphosphate) 3'-pyrophosphohydrolase [Bacillota bacterium]HPZ40762.1 bifunctional (p)ppGpp synthetase/guanosine-3',5'-bis(diphosphate) 3'-pyrophosphohydrolase [Bacillota bacterium]HQD51721.1 bifuncti
MPVKERKLDELKKLLVRHYPDDEDWALVEKAYAFAYQAHTGQRRESGESYITHPLGVAMILAELGLDLTTIIAGLLHDVVEDTAVTLEEIKEIFGEEIATLVDGVTKLSRLDFASKEEQQAETLRKMFIAMAEDIRVVLIKLADRTHNLRTLRYLDTYKQQEIARETMEIYAPLAHRLGIYKIKWELEDHAFRYMQPEAYYQLVNKLAKKRREREQFINRLINVLLKRLEAVGITAEIQGRPKHLYSIYHKMKEQKKDFNEIYDLTAIRVIVDSVKDCYGALGTVHALWKPIPGRFKDYIAMPKPNMYQSLHTTVVAAENELVEVQIRTWEMHRTAEYGIAAHWRYKEKITDEREFDQKLAWLRQLLEWQKDYRDAREFIENLKMDLFTDEVFVFTPRGDVIDLPAGSIPIDFAYKIHTDIGNRCTGSRVNGRLVPLDYVLKTGDMVEIITSKHGSPSRDWLNMVKSAQAKNKIRSWFKRERRDENIEKGREMLERENRRLDIDLRLLLKNELVEEVAKKFNLQSADDLYAAVGYGGISVQQVIGRLREEYRRQYGVKEKPLPEARPQRRSSGSAPGVIVEGIDNILVRIARCCNPVPDDAITGLVTRGRGVSIHRSDCPNLEPYRSTSGRLLEVTWEGQADRGYQVAIEISAHDRANLLTDIMTAVSESRIQVTAVNGRTDADNTATIQLTLTVKDRVQLEQVMNRIKKVKDVYSVRRQLYGRN